MSEHLDNKSVMNLRFPSGHSTVIFAKWRPPGRSNNRRVAGRIPVIILRSRDPVSLGDVEGAFHPSVSNVGPNATKDRSSRRGKEQTRSKTSMKAQVRWSDLTVDDNP